MVMIFYVSIALGFDSVALTGEPGPVLPVSAYSSSYLN